MPTKAPIQISTLGSQSTRRRVETFYDQHKSARFPNGRPWWGYVELPADPMADPCTVGNLMPGDHTDPFNSSWHAPWLPDAKYLRENSRTRKLTIDYAAMTGEYKQAVDNHYKAAALIANQNGWVAPTLYGPISYQIEALLGPVPLSHKIPQAAQAGDPWLLGVNPEPNEQLAKLLVGHSPFVGAAEVLAPEPPVKAADVLTMTPEELDAKIAEAVQKALASTGDPMAKARAAKAAKKAESQAQAPAA